LADEVEIINVGGDNGVASEATLAALLRAMEKMAGAAGVNPKELKDNTKKLNEQLKSGVTVQTKNTDALKKDTKATGSATAATNKFTNAIKGAALGAIGSLLGSVKGMAEALISGQEDISTFAQHIPIVGGYLTVLTGLIDANVESFRELSRVGGTFGDGLNEIRQLATDAAMPLGEFTQLISQNSETMRQFGAGTAQGARNFAVMSKQFRDGPGKALTAIGFTAQELNETLLDYAEIQGRQMGAERLSGRESLQRAAEFGEQLQLLSAITGKRREQIAEEMKQNQADARVRLAMANMSREEAERFNANLATADAGLRDALTDMADGVANNPTAQAFTVASETFRQRAKDIENMSPEEFNNFMVTVREESERYQRSLGAGAEAVMNANQGMADVFNFAARDAQRRRITEEEAAKLRKDQLEQQKRDDSILNFQNSIRDLRASLMDTLIKSGVLETLQNAFGSLATALGDPKRMQGFKDALRTAAEAIKTFIDNFTNFDLKTALFGGTADKTITDANGNVIHEAGDQIEGLVGNLFGEGGPFAKALEGVGTAIGDAFKSMLLNNWEYILGGFVALFAAKAVVSTVAGAIASLFTGGAIANRLGGGGGGGRSNRGGGGGRGSSRAASNAGSGIGNFIGNVGGGALQGAARGLAAFANPLVVAGAAALGAAIAAIGAGIAGATWLVGNSLPSLTEGLKGFEELDGGKLIDAGKGMAAVAAGMAAFGAGSAVAGLGALVGSITEGIAGLFGAEDPLDKVKRFGEANIDGDKVESNANALIAFSRAMAIASGIQGLGSLGTLVGSIATGIAGLFSSNDPLEQARRFAEYDIDANKVENNANALVAYSKAMAASSGIQGLGSIGTLVGSIANGISSFFGGETGIPYDQITRFQSYAFDSEKIQANAQAMVAFNNALASSASAQSAGGVASAIGAIGSAISSFFGADTPFDQVQAFGNMNINAEGVRANAEAMSSFANALRRMQGSDFGEIEIPRALVTRLRELSEITGGGLTETAQGMQAIASIQGLQTNLDILRSGLDTEAVRSYKSLMKVF